MKKIYHCRTLQDTEKAARAVAELLRGRETLAFFGGLGAGKTTFIRFLCASLGVEDEVTSPTFAMVHEYTALFPVYHFDMYRVDGEESLYSTGYYDYLDNGLLLIEWSEHIEPFLPPDAWRITLNITAEGTREISLEREDNG